jgi:hypothetical protein
MSFSTPGVLDGQFNLFRGVSAKAFNISYDSHLRAYLGL